MTPKQLKLSILDFATEIEKLTDPFMSSVAHSVFAIRCSLNQAERILQLPVSRRVKLPAITRTQLTQLGALYGNVSEQSRCICQAAADVHKDKVGQINWTDQPQPGKCHLNIVTQKLTTHKKENAIFVEGKKIVERSNRQSERIAAIGNLMDRQESARGIASSPKPKKIEKLHSGSITASTIEVMRGAQRDDIAPIFNLMEQLVMRMIAPSRTDQIVHSSRVAKSLHVISDALGEGRTFWHGNSEKNTHRRT